MIAVLAPVLELVRALESARVMAAVQGPVVVQELDWAVARELDWVAVRGLVQAVEQGLALDWAVARGPELVRALARDLVLVRELVAVRAPARAQDLALGQAED